MYLTPLMVRLPLDFALPGRVGVGFESAANRQLALPAAGLPAALCLSTAFVAIATCLLAPAFADVFFVCNGWYGFACGVALMPLLRLVLCFPV